ncbi:hypothetical protein ACIA58_08825 [Kribbella sp. NPDC051586]|uniref:hypothetical protein n=1 Tax=Kribbella sp. NPDC051586 TaxID=3364118 RepID=UPI00379BD34C
MKVTSFRELMREQAKAAVQVSGANHSSWNGRFGTPIPSPSELGGTANWDNSISYNPRHVDEPLQDMFRNARVHNQDKSELRRYRDAIRVVLHENVHLLASEGREHSQSYAAMANGPGVRQLEEGVTELYAHQRLDAYIDELGVDQVAPGIKNVKSPMVYKEFTPAVEGFAEIVGRQSGVPRDELIGKLAVVPADQKFRVAAEAMYDNSKLPGLIPAEQREQAVGQIARAMGTEFSKVSKLPKDADANARHTVGVQAAAEGSKVISRLKKQWQMPAPGEQVQRGTSAEQGRTTQSDRGNDPRSPAASEAPTVSPGPAGSTAVPGSPAPAASAASAASPPAPASAAASAAPAEPAAPALPPDVAAAARAGLSGPPLASASRLSADRQGARGAGAAAPAVQRQGSGAQRPGPEGQR